MRDAQEISLGVGKKFKKNWTVHYNLARYACQLGDLDESCRQPKQAFALNPSARTFALEAKDLKPLWPKVKEI